VFVQAEAQAAASSPDLISVLQREPKAELEAVLDLLEPVACSTTG